MFVACGTEYAKVRFFMFRDSLFAHNQTYSFFSSVFTISTISSTLGLDI